MGGQEGGELFVSRFDLAWHFTDLVVYYWCNSSKL